MSCFPFIAAGREFEVINLRLALPLLLSPFSFPRGTTLSSSMRVKRDQISSINLSLETHKVDDWHSKLQIRRKIKNEKEAHSDFFLCSHFLVVLTPQWFVRGHQ